MWNLAPMSLEISRGNLEAQRLTEKAASAATQMPVAEAAGTGFVQAVMAQAACNALLDILVAKHIVTPTEAARLLGDSYRSYGDRMFSQRLVSPAAVVPPGLSNR